MPAHPILDRRLLLVSGKGGAGKTVATAALALYGHRRRKRVLVVELSPHGRIHELLGGPVPGPEPREIRPRLELVRVEPRRALEEFVRRILPIAPVRRRLLSSHSFSILAAAAPGIEEFLVLVQIARLEALRAGLGRRPRYDLVLVDAPATGHSLPLLSTAHAVAELMSSGPLRGTAREVSRLLGDPARAAAVIVALPEELVVNETLEIAAELSRSGTMALGPLIVNGVCPERFTPEEARWLMGGGADPFDPWVAVGRHEVERRRRAEEQLARLRRALGVEPVELPFAVDATLERPHLRRLVGALERAMPPRRGVHA